MAENNKVNSVSFFNSRLTSIISIALVLFLLGLILLMGLLWKPVVGLCQGKYIIFYCIERQSERS